MSASSSTYNTVLVIRESIVIFWTATTSIFLAIRSYKQKQLRNGQEQKQKHTKSNNRSPFIFAQMYFICMCMSYVLRLIDRINGDDDQRWTFRYLVSWILFNIALVSVYLFVFFRLINTFRNSKHKVSKSVIFLHIANINIIEVLFTTQALLDYVELFPWDVVFGALTSFVCLLGLAHLEYLFNRKLFDLILERRTTANIASPKAEDNLSKVQMAFIPVIVKHTVVTAWILGSLTMFTVVTLLVGIAAITPQGVDVTSRETFDLYIPAATINIAIVASSMYLSFRATATSYQRYCNWCDKRLRSFYIKKTSSKSMYMNSIDAEDGVDV